ncbi:MAG: hypothetical protein NVS3B12_26460 [Acidimicrobiales bacterium]
MRFIDENRSEFGVEPICSVLQVAPSTYYCAKSRPASARALSDARLKVVLLALWCANYEVYGARKLWKAAVRAGHGAGRDQIARLMRELGIRGMHRGTKVRTTRPDERAARHPDLVKRRFRNVKQKWPHCDGLKWPHLFARFTSSGQGRTLRVTGVDR